MRKLFWVLLIIVVAAVGAPAQKVKVAADPAANLSAYKTYNWDKPLPPGNPMVQQTILASLEQALTAKGLKRVEDRGDITVVFLAATDTDLQMGYPSWYSKMGSAVSNGMDVGTQSWPVTRGMLVVDVVDNKTKNSVWRGSATHTLEHGLTGNPVKDARTVEKPIRKSIEKMFKKFPQTA